MYTKAIVWTPCKNMIEGLTTANLGIPNPENALKQHEAYIEALQECGLDVIVLPPDEDFPDSTFVEDTAVLTPQCAIICHPGAPSRRGEIVSMRPALERFFNIIEQIESPGTVDGGDVLKVGDHYYIGISGRTNLDGAKQLGSILKKYGMSSTMVPLKKVLHLKSGVAYLENNNLVVTGEFIHQPAFNDFHRIIVDDEESYAANCVWINGTVLIASGFPKIKKKVGLAGYRIIELDVSEFRKLDGGLSCLSLRF